MASGAETVCGGVVPSAVQTFAGGRVADERDAALPGFLRRPGHAREKTFLSAIRKDETSRDPGA